MNIKDINDNTVCMRLSTERWSVISAVIRWRGNSKHSHVEFEFPNGATLGARFSLRGKIARKLGGRPRRWRKLDGVQFRCPEANRKQINIIRYTFDRIGKAAVWVATNRLTAPYDLLGIAGIVTARGWADSKDDFCSEVMQEGAQNGANNPFQNCSPQDVLPDDCEKSLIVRLFGGWI